MSSTIQTHWNFDKPYFLVYFTTSCLSSVLIIEFCRYLWLRGRANKVNFRWKGAVTEKKPLQVQEEEVKK